MELMEQTDMLIVAGGDGTLQEVITGLLRRPDQVGCHRVIFLIYGRTQRGQLHLIFLLMDVLL